MGTSTREDALERIADAKLGSLDGTPTTEYLLALRSQVYIWGGELDGYLKEIDLSVLITSEITTDNGVLIRNLKKIKVARVNYGFPGASSGLTFSFQAQVGGIWHNCAYPNDSWTPIQGRVDLDPISVQVGWTELNMIFELNK